MFDPRPKTTTQPSIETHQESHRQAAEYFRFARDAIDPRQDQPRTERTAFVSFYGAIAHREYEVGRCHISVSIECPCTAHIYRPKKTCIDALPRSCWFVFAHRTLTDQQGQNYQ